MTHFVGNVGTVFRAKVVDQDGKPVDISAASTLTFKWKAPDGTVDSHTASLSTDGTDGLCQYTTTSAADLDQAGTWEWQVFADWGTNEWHSSTKTFDVKAILA